MQKIQSLLTLQPLLKWQSQLKRRRQNRQIKNSKKTPWQQCDFLALDMETTGLKPTKDTILSLGWIAIQKGAIKLSTANHLLLNTGIVEESTVGIHLITDTDIENQGRDPKSTARYLRRLLTNRIVVAHHAPIEIGFLKQLWQTYQIKPLSIILLDTLAIERAYQHKAQKVLRDGAYRLKICRERYGLPEYQSHDALTDALATAELLLAQIAHGNSNMNLEDLIRLGGQSITLKP